MILRREETSELSAQVQRLVARLMDRDQNVEETFNGLECRIVLRSTAKKHECSPIYRGSSLSLIVLFQRESLLELVYTQQTQILALRDCWDVVDLTLDSDSEDSAMPVESIAKVPRSAVRDSDRSLIPIEEGHSVGKQRCIHSLGRIKRTSPYWTTATGVRRGKGELQLLESGSRSDSASSWEWGCGMRDAGGVLGVTRDRDGQGSTLRCPYIPQVIG